MRSAIALAATAVVFIACSGSGGASPSPAATPVTTPAATSTAAAAAAGVQLSSSSLGQIVTDTNGRTLYAFTPDEAGGQPTCAGDCATKWPAFTVSGDFAVGSGLDKSKFTTVTGTTGGTQLKFGEYPLYYFSGDSGPNQTNGQGLGGKWFVIGADGELVGESS